MTVDAQLEVERRVAARAPARLGQLSLEVDPIAPLDVQWPQVAVQRVRAVAATEARSVGTVVTVTDGICRIHGLQDAVQGEMLEFPKNTFGLALNLERDSVGAVILGEYEHITEGDTVKCTGRILEVPVGPELIGRVVNALGQPIDGKGPVTAKARTSPSAVSA